MSGFTDGPKFRGDLSDHLPSRAEPMTDRWTDRLRHAWFAYLIALFLTSLWIGGMVLAFVEFGWGGWLIAMMVGLFPLAIYRNVLLLRLFSGRDPDTGERWRPSDR